MQSEAASAATPEPESGTNRLVIRVKLVSQTPPPPPAWRGLSRSALLLIFGGVAVVLSWIGSSMFKPERASEVESAAVADPRRAQPEQPGSEAATRIGNQPLAPPATETAAAHFKPAASEAMKQADAPTSPINQVVPDVPRSALDTIRGTVRVAIRVTLDQSGAVRAVSTDERGPSRYFERLATEAAKQWTFTPATSEERVMLLKFNFTRDGATASASSPS